MRLHMYTCTLHTHVWAACANVLIAHGIARARNIAHSTCRRLFADTAHARARVFNGACAVASIGDTYMRSMRMYYEGHRPKHRSAASLSLQLPW